MTTGPVDRLLEGIRTANVPGAQALADDAVLDATVPHWRFTVGGGERIAAQFAEWYADPGEFEEIHRTPLPDGELVRFFLVWEEKGVPHGAHQTHVLQVHGDRIVSDTMFCGGRWPASLLAEMESQAHAG